MLGDVPRNGEAEAHALAGPSDVAHNSIQREHHLGQHDLRPGELDALHGNAFEEPYRIHAARHDRQFVEKTRDELRNHPPPR